MTTLFQLRVRAGGFHERACLVQGIPWELSTPGERLGAARVGGVGGDSAGFHTHSWLALEEPVQGGVRPVGAASSASDSRSKSPSQSPGPGGGSPPRHGRAAVTWSSGVEVRKSLASEGSVLRGTLEPLGLAHGIVRLIGDPQPVQQHG